MKKELNYVTCNHTAYRTQAGINPPSVPARPRPLPPGLVPNGVRVP